MQQYNNIVILTNKVFEIEYYCFNQNQQTHDCSYEYTTCNSVTYLRLVIVANKLY